MSPVPLLTESSGTTQTADGVFYMPTVAAVTTTAGYFLASKVGLISYSLSLFIGCLPS